ncbi:hypothetical protein [Roseateles sp.]|uniref:hypothetical protein n=1 Tax=Roseateles sp. TaxID=1971397 RepID=UPI002E081CCB|nr:hypothetical protein [Roseateles sp.]
MARSSLLGIDPAPTEAEGRGKARLGPSDTTDSGSDLAGLDDQDDDADPGLPVDVALRDDQVAPLPLGETLAESEGGASGVRDGADIGVDRVFTPGGLEVEADAALAAVGEAPLDEASGDEADAGEEEQDAADEESEFDENDTGPARRPRRDAPGTAPGEASEAVPGGPDPAGHRPGRS